MFNNFFNRKSCPVWGNVEKHLEPDRPQLTIWCMRIACWIPKTTNTHSEYAIRIAFSNAVMVHEPASMLRCT
jgi:hypothetical protein